MKTTASTRTALVVGFILIAFNGLFLFGNGLFMLITPMAWYDFVPSVTPTLVPLTSTSSAILGLFRCSSAPFGIGMIQPARRFDLWAAATSWLIAHASFHLWEVAVGISSPSAILRDFPAVTLPALIGVALTAWVWRTSLRSASLV